MASLSGKERTEGEWRTLIGQVEGLRVDKIWELETQAESLIEPSKTGPNTSVLDRNDRRRRRHIRCSIGSEETVL
jgi:hypothetical protein